MIKNGSNTARRQQQRLITFDASSSPYLRHTTQTVSQKILTVAEKCYKTNQDKKVCFEGTYVPSGYVFIYKPALQTSAKELWATKGYPNLVPKRYGQYCILCAEPRYLKTLRVSIKTSTSVNRATCITKNGWVLDQPYQEYSNRKKGVTNPRPNDRTRTGNNMP